MNEDVADNKDEVGLDRFLGKTSPKVTGYDPELLVAIPRAVNREANGMREVAETFFGVDVWTVFEASFLVECGLPVVGVIQFSVPSDSRCIVESKSVKLYFSSLNSERLGATREEAIEAFKNLVAKDIAAKTESEISVRWVDHWNSVAWKEAYTTLEFIPAVAKGFQITSAELSVDRFDQPRKYLWHSALLRSQCRITQQPDWGDIYIEISGKTLPRPESILSKIVSQREEEHFHEEIVEALYANIWNICGPDCLFVFAQYTRRGGVDINPLRCSDLSAFEHVIEGAFPLFQPTFRQ